MPNKSSNRVREPLQGGFTVVEMIVALGTMVVIAAGLLTLFDFGNRVSKTQTGVTEMQQSLRGAQYQMVKMARMVGRGGLPAGTVPLGLAVAVRDNVPDDDRAVAPAAPEGSPLAVQGTDILIVRGVFSTPIFQVNSSDPATFSRSVDGGTVSFESLSVTGVPQGLDPLQEAIDNSYQEALMLVSPANVSIYGVVALDPQASSIQTLDVTQGLYKANLSYDTTGPPADLYLQLSPGGAFPADLTSAAFVGVLEEYRFYVREVTADLESTEVRTATSAEYRLSVARVYPGTDLPYADDPANLRIDIADNVYDLQVSFGVDLDGDGRVTENSDDLANDEWLYNSPGDDAAAVLWAAGQLGYLRLNTLVQSERPERGLLAAKVSFIEKHEFLGSDSLNGAVMRMYRRRLLRTVVDMRNLG